MDKAKLFVIWLDGFLEGYETLDEKRVQILKKKLDGLFEQVAEHGVEEPKMGNPHFSSNSTPAHSVLPGGEKMRC